jgi:transcription antitermination factor NusG
MEDSQPSSVGKKGNNGSIQGALVTDISFLGSPEPSLEVGAKQYPWYALQVRTRYEKTVAEMLHGKGYSPFLPLYKCARRWSHRLKILELPLFPGYLFCRFNAQHRLPILTTPAVIQVLGVSGTPIPINESEINAIRTIVASGLKSQPWPLLEIGTRVRIEYGALCGLEGVLLDFRGRHRLIVSVTLLQRAVAVEVDRAWTSPLISITNSQKVLELPRMEHTQVVSKRRIDVTGEARLAN